MAQYYREPCINWPFLAARRLSCVRASEKREYRRCTSLHDAARITQRRAAQLLLFPKEALIAWTQQNRWTVAANPRHIRMNSVSPARGHADPWRFHETLGARCRRRHAASMEPPGRADISRPVVAFLLSDYLTTLSVAQYPSSTGHVVEHPVRNARAI